MKRDSHSGAVKLREMRRKRGLTQAALGRALGVSGKDVSRMETGELHTRKHAVKLARFFGAPVAEFLDDGAVEAPEHGALREEALPFAPEPGTFAAQIALNDHQFWRKLQDTALDQIGYIEGDEVIVDVGAAAMRTIETGDVVIANKYSDDGKTAETIVRQFVAPNLLITNSSRRAEILNIDRDGVSILGVVVFPKRKKNK